MLSGLFCFFVSRVSTHAVDCLEYSTLLVSAMTYYVLCVEWDVKHYSLDSTQLSIVVVVLFNFIHQGSPVWPWWLLSISLSAPVVSCVFSERKIKYLNCVAQDLSRLGRDLSQVVIIDNSPASYVLHPENAVSIVLNFSYMLSMVIYTVYNSPETYMILTTLIIIYIIWTVQVSINYTA